MTTGCSARPRMSDPGAPKSSWSPIRSTRSRCRSSAPACAPSPSAPAIAARWRCPICRPTRMSKRGDLLMTSGLGGVFPPGYPVARITEVHRDAVQPLAQVRAMPLARIDRDREVMLVWFEDVRVRLTPEHSTAAGAAAPERSRAAPPQRQRRHPPPRPNAAAQSPDGACRRRCDLGTARKPPRSESQSNARMREPCGRICF